MGYIVLGIRVVILFCRWKRDNVDKARVGERNQYIVILIFYDKMGTVQFEIGDWGEY